MFALANERCEETRALPDHYETPGTPLRLKHVTGARKAVAALRQAKARFVTRTEIGPTAETIARLVRVLHADQIVMGTRGLGAIGRLVLGAVALDVIRLAGVPVTLVK